MKLTGRTVIAVTGLPTSGKTELMKALAAALGVHYVDIDDGPAKCGPLQEMDPHATEESLAREGRRMRVAYTVLHAAVEGNLGQNFPLVICATYSKHGSQDFLKKAVESQGGILKVVLCEYDDTLEEVTRRIEKRINTGTTGGCRSVAHYYTDKGKWEGIKLPHLVVQMNGEGGVQNAVAKVLEYLAL
ncbi:MAG: AAA family ATPase [bacterium]|nr:AAA family ATPase [bacterium]